MGMDITLTRKGLEKALRTLDTIEVEEVSQIPGTYGDSDEDFEHHLMKYLKLPVRGNGYVTFSMGSGLCMNALGHNLAYDVAEALDARGIGYKMEP